MTAIILERSLGLAGNVRTEAVVGRLELAAESGLQRALHELLSPRGRASAVVHRQLQVEGAAVRVSTQFSDGLVGLRNRDKDYVERGSAAALGGRGARVAQVLLGPSVGAISSYVGLAKLSDLGMDELACLLTYVSLYTDNGAPVPAHAPGEVLGLLRSARHPSASEIQGETKGVAGSVVRIRARASIDGYSSRELLAEVLLTGRLDTPYLILDWLWLPVDSGPEKTSRKCAKSS